MVDAHGKQLAQGLTAQQVKFTTSVPVLRNASVKPIVGLFEWAQGLAGRDLIKRAWEKCTVGEYNLSTECITSKKTKAAYREYLRNHPDFRKEIKNKINGDVFSLLDEKTLAAAEQIEARSVAEMGDDDIDVVDAETTIRMSRCTELFKTAFSSTSHLQIYPGPTNSVSSQMPLLPEKMGC
ncbi:hypothetical protein B0H10DRAFT_1942557 [Mycena sp. CBHHK59/15]|nr:hypothetical protein B0H10DRAFT_1942557 [Mycena sp. CBHHK59/15]